MDTITSLIITGKSKVYKDFVLQEGMVLVKFNGEPIIFHKGFVEDMWIPVFYFEENIGWYQGWFHSKEGEGILPFIISQEIGYRLNNYFGNFWWNNPQEVKERRYRTMADEYLPF